jgi:hypothetical protein
MRAELGRDGLTTSLRTKPFLLTYFSQPFWRICSCIDIGQFEQSVGHRCGADRRPGESRHHGGEIVSPIEPILELSEVARHVLLIDRAVGSDNGGAVLTHLNDIMEQPPQDFAFFIRYQ